jgi:hypothetical protein
VVVGVLTTPGAVVVVAVGLVVVGTVALAGAVVAEGLVVACCTRSDAGTEKIDVVELV